ncbi:hypothetical protein EXU57_06850 [Segetibacter sp. 3557_3]|uniref:hypothetical protein n=1 Tax=Segetibacter sp. 3557_3 TaxID=2547429 RepID=UPI001058B1EF|nr:hypothetical protein [Segetibacter sp. 3557_3]TDH27302.1 hypothetical protein EXU57_06850 [Segetibacter sp. 3557_3]
MNNDQNNNPAPEENENTGKVFLMTGSSLQSEEEYKEDKETKHDDDAPMVLTTNIGDGEMRNEGLAESGDPEDIQFEATAVIPPAPDDIDE